MKGIRNTEIQFFFAQPFFQQANRSRNEKGFTWGVCAYMWAIREVCTHHPLSGPTIKKKHVFLPLKASDCSNVKINFIFSNEMQFDEICFNN